MNLRVWMLALIGTAVVHAQPPDVADLLARSAAAGKANEAQSSRFAYKRYVVNRELDKNGKETERHTETWDAIGLEGSTYSKLVQRDDKPLSAKEQKKVDQELAKETAKRRKETPEQRRNRLLSFGYSVGFTADNMHLFDVKYVGEETVQGRPAYLVEGVPKPDAKPRNSNEKELLHYRFRRWIDREDYNGARLELEIIRPGSRMQEGSRIELQLAPIDGVWMPEELRIRFSVRFFKLAGARGESTITYSDFHRFQVESHLIDAAQ